MARTPSERRRSSRSGRLHPIPRCSKSSGAHRSRGSERTMSWPHRNCSRDNSSFLSHRRNSLTSGVMASVSSPRRHRDCPPPPTALEAGGPGSLGPGPRTRYQLAARTVVLGPATPSSRPADPSRRVPSTLPEGAGRAEVISLIRTLAGTLRPGRTYADLPTAANPGFAAQTNKGKASPRASGRERPQNPRRSRLSRRRS